MSSPTDGLGLAADTAATPSQPSRTRSAAATGRNDPKTPLILHPPTAIADPAAAAAARISAAARTAADAAAAGFVAAREGVKKLQHTAAAPSGPVHRAGFEIGEEDERDLDSPTAAMARLGSDMGLAGLAEAAGHAWCDLPHFGTWRQRVQLVKLAAGLVLTMTLVYSFFYAPNKLGMRHDLSMLSRAFYDNALAFVLFNLLGLFPFITGCLMWPALRSKGLKPAMWPHLVASYFTGTFAVLSYLVRWRPHQRGMPRLALRAARLTGDHVWLQHQHESRLMPAIVTATIATLLALCLAATPATWAHFGFLFSHSKAVHVMVLDLSLLTLTSPFLVVADARARGVRFAQSPAGAILLGSAMLAIPLVGPGVYLVMRPITTDKGLATRGRRAGFSRQGLWVPEWLSHLWPFHSVATPTAGQIKAAATTAKGQVLRGGRQLRRNAAAAVATAGSNAAAAATAAGSNAAAAGSNAAAVGSSVAANVVTAAHIPLPTERQVQHATHAAADSAAYGAGSAMGRIRSGWERAKEGATRLLSGGMRDGGVAFRTGSADGGLEDYGSHEGIAGGTDSSDSTEHQHHEQQHQQQHNALNFPAHNALGTNAYFVTSVSPGGGRELLFADDYNEAEADVMADSDDDMTQEEDDGSQDDDDVIMDEDEIVSGGEDDVTYDVGEGVLDGEGEGAEQGVRRGGYRQAKAVALDRLAEIAHFEHPRIA